MNGIIQVIEELGLMIEKYKDEIKFKNYEIDSLKREIEKLERQNASYSKERSYE